MTIRLACSLAVLVSLALGAPAAAQSPLVPPNSSVGGGSTTWGPLQWNEGTVATGTTQSCLFGTPTTEQLGAAWLSWYGDLGVSPQVDQTFYVKMSWFVSGFPCGTGSAYVAPEFTLPRATSLAVSSTTPVRCFARLDDARGWQEFSRSECPQAPTGSGRGGGMAFNPTDGSAAWPTASGVAYEVWIPVRASEPLTGDSPGAGEGCPNCVYGGAWFIDGIDAPFMRPNVFVYTGPGGTTTPAARVQAPLPNHYISRDSQNPHLAANQQARCVPSTETVSSWVTGEVYSKEQSGSAYFEFGTGHPTGTPTYSIDKNSGAPTDVGAPAGDWRYDLCVLNFVAGTGDRLPPGDYHYRFCWDPGTYNANSTVGDVCTADQKFAVPNPSETTAPTTTIVRKPGATSGPDVEFTFASNEPGSTFECSLDNAAFSPCLVLSLKNLAAGQHTLRVRAKDPAGNRDATPASYTWTVVTPSSGGGGGGSGSGGGGGTTTPPPTSPPPALPPTSPAGPVNEPVRGPATPAGCVVPKLKGKTLKQAKKLLKKARCKLGKVKKKKVRGKKAKPGRILSTKPKAGKVLKRGAKVAVVVGKR